eukprot:712442-Amphidinium_carterae.1
MDHFENLEGMQIHKALPPDGLKTEPLSMLDLWTVAQDTGDYHVATANCHHLAFAVFNACAREGYKALSMPNALPMFFGK